MIAEVGLENRVSVFPETSLKYVKCLECLEE